MKEDLSCMNDKERRKKYENAKREGYKICRFFKLEDARKTMNPASSSACFKNISVDNAIDCFLETVKLPREFKSTFIGIFFEDGTKEIYKCTPVLGYGIVEWSKKIL